MDYKAGQTVVKSGMLITPPIISAIASLNKRSMCNKKPTVSLISTGNEIIMPGEKLKEGQIYDSNSFAISSAIRNSELILKCIRSFQIINQMLRNYIKIVIKVT